MTGPDPFQGVDASLAVAAPIVGFRAQMRKAGVAGEALNVMTADFARLMYVMSSIQAVREAVVAAPAAAPRPLGEVLEVLLRQLRDRRVDGA